MPDTSTTPMNHDYDSTDGSMTPRGGQQLDNNGNPVVAPSRSPTIPKLPKATDPKHMDSDGKMKSDMDIADAMS